MKMMAPNIAMPIVNPIAFATLKMRERMSWSGRIGSAARRSHQLNAMDVTARGRIVKDTSGGIALQFEPNRSFAIAPNEVSKGLEPLAGSETTVTVRGELYKKSAGKKKADTSAPLKLLILEVQKKE